MLSTRKDVLATAREGILAICMVVTVLLWVSALIVHSGAGRRPHHVQVAR
jgi:hypothetical protein